MTTILCGAGFLGSWHARFLGQRLLAMHQHHDFVIIDNGMVEERNIPTQNFTPSQMGVGKANITLRELEKFQQGGVALNELFTPDLSKKLLKKYPNATLVVDCFDNLPARTQAMLLARQYGCECLHLSISEEGWGRVEWSNKWHLDPTRNLTPVVKPDVKIPPCELVAFQALGVQVGLRGAMESAQRLMELTIKSWEVTPELTQSL